MTHLYYRGLLLRLPERDPGCGNVSLYPGHPTSTIPTDDIRLCVHGPEHACQHCRTGGAPRPGVLEVLRYALADHGHVQLSADEEARRRDLMERRSSTLHPMEGTP